MNSIAPSIWLPPLHLLRAREEQQIDAGPIPRPDSQGDTAAAAGFCALFLVILSRMIQMHFFHKYPQSVEMLNACNRNKIIKLYVIGIDEENFNQLKIVAFSACVTLYVGF